MTFGPHCRAWFALADDLVLLNHGSYGATPRSVLAAQASERAALEADPMAYMFQLPERLRAVVGRIAPIVGAPADTLALVENASSGVNTVLRSLDWRPGDRVVSTTHTYGAVRQAIQHLVDRWGVHHVEVELPWPVTGPEAVLAAVRPALVGARLAVLDHVTSATGLVLPIARLVADCRAQGVLTLVDAAHAPGLVPMAVDAVGADWTTGNLHKWLFANKGCAFLHARRPGLIPLVVSHDYAAGFPHSFSWVGTRDPTAWLSIPSALEFAEELGLDAIRAHNDGLCGLAARALSERWSVALPPASMRAAMACVPLPGVPPEALHDLYGFLRARGLAAALIPFQGASYLRISAQVYNGAEEYVRLAEGIEAYRTMKLLT